VKCANCKREMVISWHIGDRGWKLLARRWWKKILCLECFVELASHRQRHLVIIHLRDFHDIVFCAKYVRGSLTHDGKRCCVGIFGQALGIPDNVLLDVQTAYGCANTAKLWPQWAIFKAYGNISEIYDTNDNRLITEKQREEKIAELFAVNGIQVEFIN